MISIRNAFLQFNQSILFENLSFDIPEKKITCLLGRSGVGKSTLLRMIAGLLIDDKNTIVKSQINCSFTLENQIAYQAQSDLLLPWLNALDNAILGSNLRGEKNPETVLRAEKFFSQVGLSNALKKFPHELSGGMKQRVALIRTLMEDKPIVLMDEPFSSLDAITRLELQPLTVELLRDKTVLMVTHDPLEALRIADEVVVMSGQPATVEKILHLTTATPRNLNNEEIFRFQEKLYEALQA